MRRWSVKHKRTVWNEELAEKAINLRARQFTCQQIADELDKTYAAIKSFFSRLQMDEKFYFADAREKRQVIRKQRMKEVLAAKPKIPAKRNCEIIAKLDERLPPLQIAKITLGRRFTDSGVAFYLDGREVGLNDVIRATNCVLLAQGSEQVLNNPAWRVEV